MKPFLQDLVAMHSPVIQTKQSAVLERRSVLEAIWHSERFAVRFHRKAEMLGKKSLGFHHSQWEEKITFLPRTTALDFGEMCLRDSSRGNLGGLNDAFCF